MRIAFLQLGSLLLFLWAAGCDGEIALPSGVPPAMDAAGGGTGGAGGASGTGGGGGSAGGLSRSGRWMLYNGAYTYLVGVDAQELAANRTVDYVTVLDQFRAHRINKVRIWLDNWFCATCYRPWSYDAATGKFDLGAPDPTYWARMEAFVSDAQARDIIVEVSIFDAYPYPDPSNNMDWWLSTLFHQAWNSMFNVNGVFNISSASCSFGSPASCPAFFNVGGPLMGYQQALVDQAILHLGSFPNVFFEVDNEFPGDFQGRGYIQQDYPWQLSWAQYLKQNSSQLVNVHAHDSSGANLTGIEYYWDQSTIDSLNFHFYTASADGLSALLHGAQRKGKILQCNESYEWYTNGAVDAAKLDLVTREAWGWFVSGGYYAFYNGHLTNVSGWEQLGLRALSLHNIVDQVSWWTMSPVDSAGAEYDALVSQGPTTHWQVLANPGSQYVVFFDSGGVTAATTPVQMQLTGGPYTYHWYDPASGTLLSTGSVAGGGPSSIPGPPGNWNTGVGVVLLVR